MDKRIAFPTNDEFNVEAHFGHCSKFAIFTVNKDGEVKEKSFIPAPPHQPGLLPRFLGEKGANVIITGGMGQRAVDLFKAQGIEVIMGAIGNMEENLKVYLSGDLESTGSVCNHDHDHGQHGHGHSCK
jgi:predicted Fe-Mo cluster-binding NifX family protein